MTDIAHGIACRNANLKLSPTPRHVKMDPIFSKGEVIYSGQLGPLLVLLRSTSLKNQGALAIRGINLDLQGRRQAGHPVRRRIPDRHEGSALVELEHSDALAPDAWSRGDVAKTVRGCKIEIELLLGVFLQVKLDGKDSFGALCADPGGGHIIPELLALGAQEGLYAYGVSAALIRELDLEAEMTARKLRQLLTGDRRGAGVDAEEGALKAQRSRLGTFIRVCRSADHKPQPAISQGHLGSRPQDDAFLYKRIPNRYPGIFSGRIELQHGLGLRVERLSGRLFANRPGHLDFNPGQQALCLRRDELESGRQLNDDLGLLRFNGSLLRLGFVRRRGRVGSLLLRNGFALDGPGRFRRGSIKR